MDKSTAAAIVALNPERYRLYETSVIYLAQAKQSSDDTCNGCVFDRPGSECPKDARYRLVCISGSEEVQVWKKLDDQD